MPHVLVAGKLHPSGAALLDQAESVTYDYVEEISEESYAPLIEKADGLVIRTQPMTAATVAKASQPQIVSRHGNLTVFVDFEEVMNQGCMYIDY